MEPYEQIKLKQDHHDIERTADHRNQSEQSTQPNHEHNHGLNHEAKVQSSCSRSTKMTDASSSDDDETASTFIERPLCYKIFGCGPSEIYPASEIRIETSLLSSDIMNVQSDVSSSSNESAPNNRRERNLHSKETECTTQFNAKDDFLNV
jgi:hypothetical protein